MNVCQRNVARFGHVECIFDKVNDIFQGFGSLVSLRLQKDGRDKCKQIWTNLSHWDTDGLSSRCEGLLLFFFNLYANVQLMKRDIVTAVIYYYITTEFHYAKRDSAYAGVSVWLKTLIDILGEILIHLIFSNKNNRSQWQRLHTSMLKGESHVSRTSVAV